MTEEMERGKAGTFEMHGAQHRLTRSEALGMNLLPRDLEMFSRLGIDAGLLEKARVERLTDSEARDRLGINGRYGDMAGIWFPYRNPRDGYRWTGRIRRDHPEEEDGRPKNKYLSAYGDRRHLFFAPGANEVIDDLTVPAVLVEAEKSCLSLAGLGTRSGKRMLPIALGGCYGWRGRIGKIEKPNGERVDELGALPDLRVCTARKTFILLDANCATNTKVQAARRDLARAVRKIGGFVHILDLPARENVNGPDDFIGIYGDHEMLRILEGADSGAELLGAVESFLRRFVVMSDSQFISTALWICHTHCFSASIYTPYLSVTSAEKRCGKSRVLEAVSYLVRSPWRTSSASAASLFREIDKKRPTLLLDEVDALFKADKEMAQAVRGVLNAGSHYKGTVSRCVGQGASMDSKDFSCFCPNSPWCKSRFE
jgi:Domain of unknown function (DUF3854)